MLSKRALYDKLVIKVNAIDTKMPSTSGLVGKTAWFRQTRSSEEDRKSLQKDTQYQWADQKDWLQHKNYRAWEQDT